MTTDGVVQAAMRIVGKRDHQRVLPRASTPQLG
jgi:hypothetical protein